MYVRFPVPFFLCALLLSAANASAQGLNPADEVFIEEQHGQNGPELSAGTAQNAQNIDTQNVDVQNTARNQCTEPFANHYRKSVAFAGFPRLIPASSSAGALHQVDQHLPLLLAENLRNRHATLTPVQLPQAFLSADHSGELGAAAQAQALARKHRTQFLVSGEVQDMSMTFPGAAYTPGLYSRFVNGVHNFLHINTPLDKRSRLFSFHLQLRDGFTGQILFDNHYRTYGKWKAVQPMEIGFGSPRFWKSDYGRQVSQLIARAGDELAAAIECQPYIARIDARPGEQQVIIHSGANNGLRAGDTLELYQLVMQQATGEYDKFDARLIKRNAPVYLTEVYPSHSVANINDEILLHGQYLALAP